MAALSEVSNQNICLSLFESDERDCPRIVVGIVLLICVAANSYCLWISGLGAGWGRVRCYRNDSSQAVASSTSCTHFYRRLIKPDIGSFSMGGIHLVAPMVIGFGGAHRRGPLPLLVSRPLGVVPR